MLLDYKRPESIPYPSIWCKFTAKDLDSDNLVEYFIQDLTEEHFNDAIELLKKNFITGEFLKKHLNVSEDPISTEDICNCWWNVLSQKVSIACFKGTELVGVNLVFVDDKWDQPKKFNGANQQLMYNANMFLDNKFDYKSKFSVDLRLNAIALCVNARYRGRNIGPEILKARIPLCKALGIKVTVNNFSCAIAQRTAEKAGFVSQESVSFKELKENGIFVPGVDENLVMKVMSLQIQ